MEGEARKGIRIINRDKHAFCPSLGRGPALNPWYTIPHSIHQGAQKRETFWLPQQNNNPTLVIDQ